MNCDCGCIGTSRSKERREIKRNKYITQVFCFQSYRTSSVIQLLIIILHYDVTNNIGDGREGMLGLVRVGCGALRSTES